MNDEIIKEPDLGSGFRIGHSFFCSTNGREPDEAWYREIIDGEIKPLIEEYFDSQERVTKLVNRLHARWQSGFPRSRLARLMDAGKLLFGRLQSKEWQASWLKAGIQIYLRDF